MTIADRVALVRARMARAGGTDVTLVAAAKGFGSLDVREAYEAGVEHFGENYLQEAMAKRPECPTAVAWHFIGRMQSNKVSKIATTFGTVQILDSVEKARLLSRSASGPIDVFLEVNIAEEPQKAGVLPQNVPEIAEIVYDLDNLRLIGLMTMGPENPNAEEARPYFIRMRKLLEALGLPGVDKLSMGMTADYEVAIQEGATHVRVGTGIFGPRKNR